VNISSLQPLVAYEELYWSNIAGALKRFGGSQAPLSLIGTFLNVAGNHLLYHAHQVMRKRIFYPRHEVKSVSLKNNGDIIVVTKNHKRDINVTFRAKAVIMANGGVPSMPPMVPMKLGVDKEKIVLGDDFLKRDRFMAGIEMLKQKRSPKVVIIGGSHSGFSAANMLIHGPNLWNHNKGRKKKLEFTTFPNHNLK